MKEEQLFTQQQVDIKLLNQKNDVFNQSLIRLESSLQSNMSEVKSDIRELRSYIIGIYAVMGAAALAKVFGVL
jgi:hypothetical protein